MARREVMARRLRASCPPFPKLGERGFERCPFIGIEHAKGDARIVADTRRNFDGYDENAAGFRDHIVNERRKRSAPLLSCKEDRQELGNARSSNLHRVEN